jgi:hypothetical protein
MMSSNKNGRRKKRKSQAKSYNQLMKKYRSNIRRKKIRKRKRNLIPLNMAM